jgi:hypothetical protein
MIRIERKNRFITEKKKNIYYKNTNFVFESPNPNAGIFLSSSNAETAMSKNQYILIRK